MVIRTIHLIHLPSLTPVSVQRDDPEVLPLYRELEIHPAAKDIADPSEGEELRSENPLLIGLLRRTLALIVSRPYLLEDGRQVIGQIWNQVIQVKQVCEDAVGFEEPDPFCRRCFSCLFQLQMQLTVRGPFIYKMILVSIDTFVKRTVTKSACVLW
jgi:hypothetical protein